MPSIDPHIFRAYDIRGKAGSQITPDACRKIGQAFGQILSERYKKESPTVAVGRDARTHSPELEAALIEGLVAAGCTVLHIGETPSPINYFTICDQKLDGGMQMTASHNPKEDNGIKLSTREAEAFSGEELQELRLLIDQPSPRLRPARNGKLKIENDGRGFIKKIDAVAPYVNFLTKLFKDAGKGKKVVVDSGNGVAGPVYCEILRKVGCEVIELYTKPDGTFPNHPADPSKHSTLKDLQKTVLEEKADCGFAFDGDGDRLGLVDEKGQIINADYTMLLLAEDHLSRHKGKPVIFTVSNSSLLETEVKKMGGKPVMCKVGHSFVEHAMRKHGALLGGEQSGHFFLGEGYFGFDDALVAALRVLAILSSPQARRPAAEPKKSVNSDSAAPLRGRGVSRLSLLIAQFPQVFQAPEKRPFCPDDKKAEVVEKATTFFQEKYPVITLDGARIDFGDGAWAGIRFSNTSPCLSICIEARSESKLKQVEEEVLTHLRTYKDIEWSDKAGH